eukprot:scaffold44300_cov176-Amphora_coffeaeformis.AAC.1
MADGVLDLGGEPTSVTVTHDGLYALAAVNTSPNFTDPSGSLLMIDIVNRTIVETIDVDGQPDSIDVSPDGQYAVVVIENERDEDLGDGAPPQLPGGFVWVIDLQGNMTATKVDLTNLPSGTMKFPTDPEPEFVDINTNNIAVVTLQENNHLVLIDLATATIVDDYPAGTVSLTNVDTEDNGLIDLSSGNFTDLPREADAVTWIGTQYFATADEGDLDGGTRGFTIYKPDGTVVYASGNALDHLAVKYGHYPDDRSDNKGSEPEGILYFSTTDDTHYLAILLERSSVSMLYSLPDPTDIENNPPVFAQVLPTLKAPEGIVKVPGANILAIACEEDARADKLRAGIVLYEYQDGDIPTYPVLVAGDRADGTPIPFSALSGLAVPDAVGLTGEGNMIYAIEDSAYVQSRIFGINSSVFPHVVETETRILDTNDILSSAFPPADFNNYDLVNDDKTVNMDPEGIAVSYNGGFWIANEGSGTVGDAARPIEMHNFIVKVETDGVISQLVTLPEEVNAIQVRFGFEGVAEQGDWLVVAFQRAWGDEPHPRIGIYNTVEETWKFVYYPLDDVASQYGGWVGLSDISPLGEGRFYVLERDNQGGPDAAVKKIYQIDLGADFSVEEDTVIEKTEILDLMETLESLHGYTYEKLEGLAVSASGKVYLNNDNDGVSDNSGEQYLFDLSDKIDPDFPDPSNPDAPTSSPTSSPTLSPTGPPAAAPSTFGALALLLSFVAMVVG